MFAHFFPVADTMQWSSRSYFGLMLWLIFIGKIMGSHQTLSSVPIGMVNPVAILASRSLKWRFIHHFQADKGFFKGCYKWSCLAFSSVTPWLLRYVYHKFAQNPWGATGEAIGGRACQLKRLLERLKEDRTWPGIPGYPGLFWGGVAS